jgi:hypothetical protein
MKTLNAIRKRFLGANGTRLAERHRDRLDRFGVPTMPLELRFPLFSPRGRRNGHRVASPYPPPPPC